MSDNSSQPKLTAPPRGNVLAQAWLVLLLAVGFGASLAGLDRALGPRIAENKLEETLSEIPALVPGATCGELDTTTITGRRVFRALDAKGELVGWVVPGKGQGFADKIELILGLDREAKTLTGIFVLEQKETPALGDNITTEAFRSRFAGFGTDVALTASASETCLESGNVQAISGATISSAAVCDIVNKTVTEVKAALAAAAQGAP